MAWKQAGRYSFVQFHLHKYTSTQVLTSSSSNREISYIYKNSFIHNSMAESVCHVCECSTSSKHLGISASTCRNARKYRAVSEHSASSSSLKRAASPRRCGRKHRSICEILCECCRSPRTNRIAASGIGGN